MFVNKRMKTRLNQGGWLEYRSATVEQSGLSSVKSIRIRGNSILHFEQNRNQAAAVNTAAPVAWKVGRCAI